MANICNIEVGLNFKLLAQRCRSPVESTAKTGYETLYSDRTATVQPSRSR